uniref:Uncharacterized protein AlNc14C1G194 n=1 Tax=Albugo laibachii Nc14 TaxID=890382 RepID=F0VZ53_9STRA|nr:conserved hypothetical protein [Albugo laibachii Nc14]|eukprot:CCA14068.1 conserved hypothetical protein [Albugo laibachii Nc14]
MDGDRTVHPKKKHESHTNNAIKNLIERKRGNDTGTRNKGAANKAKSSARTKRKRLKTTNGSHNIASNEEGDLLHTDGKDKSRAKDESADPPRSPSADPLTRPISKSRKASGTGLSEPEKKRSKAVLSRTGSKIKGHTLLEWLQEAAGSTTLCAEKEENSTCSGGKGEVNDRTSKRRRRDGTLTSASNKIGNEGRVRPRRKTHAGVEPSLSDTRYAVNAFEVVPEGLMDSMDGRLSRDLMRGIIRNHVDSWVSKSNFDNNFLLNLERALFQYFPINYPALLDDVIVIFLFKRPNFMESILKIITERILIEAPAVHWLKVPLMERITMICEPLNSSIKDVIRHDFACLNLLRCLIERNIDTYAFNSWISACFSKCSDSVQQSCVKRFYDSELGSSHSQMSDVGADTHRWNIQAPLQQLCGIMRTENVRGDALDKELPYSFSSACARYMLLHTNLSILEHVSFTPAFEVFFATIQTYGPNMDILKDWLQSAVSISLKEDENRLFSSLQFITKFIHEDRNVRIVITILERLLFPTVLSSQMEALPSPVVALILKDYIHVVLRSDQDTEEYKNDTGNRSMFLSYRRTRNRSDTLSLEAFRVACRLSRLLSVLSGYDNNQDFLRIWMDIWRHDPTWVFHRALIQVVIIESNRKMSKVSQSVLEVLSQSLMDLPSLIADMIDSGMAESQHSDIIKVVELMEFLLLANRNLALMLLKNIIQTLVSREIQDQLMWSIIVRPIVEMLTIDTASDFDFKNEVLFRDAIESRALSTSIAAKALETIFLLVRVDDAVGSFLRTQFSSSIVVTLFVKLLESEIIEIVVWSLQLLPCMLHVDHIEMWSEPPLLSAVLVLISSPHKRISNKAISLMEEYTRVSTSLSTLCWHLLRFGTDQYCGCPNDSISKWSQQNISILAELACLCLSSSSGMHLQYIKQHLFSCESEKSNVNVFLLVIIQRLITSDLRWNWPSIVQYALEKLSSDASEIIQGIYLDIILKTFKVGSNQYNTAAREIKSIVFSEHVVSYLQSITLKSVKSHAFFSIANQLIQLASTSVASKQKLVH